MATDESVYFVEVATPEGEKHYVTLLPPQSMLSTGLIQDAIAGQMLRPWEPEKPITPGDGYVYVIDQRTPTPDDAVPPEDIVGVFEARGGAIAKGSYRPNPNHKVLSRHGFFRLDPQLHERVVQELQSRTRA